VPRSLNQFAACAPLDSRSGTTKTASKPKHDLSFIAISNPSFTDKCCINATPQQAASLIYYRMSALVTNVRFGLQC
jgi:hypothetical protein